MKTIKGLLPQALQGLALGGALLSVSLFAAAQDSIGWTTLASDFAHTRSTPADQITPENFSDLEVAWVWDGASFEAQSGRSTPSYINGRLYTVAGARRHVVAIDPPGRYCPLYQREHYRQNSTRWRKIRRFVSGEQIVW